MRLAFALLFLLAPAAQANTICGGRVMASSWMSEPSPGGYMHRVNVVGLTDVYVSAQLTLGDSVPTGQGVQLVRGAHQTLILGTGPTQQPGGTLQANTRFTCR